MSCNCYNLGEVDPIDSASEAPFYAPDQLIGFGPAFGYLDKHTSVQFSNVQGAMYLFAKRAFDVAFSFLAIAGLFPVMALIVIATRLSSPGPVLFRQERVGKDGRIFAILKFRTMKVADRSLTDKAWSAVDDPRLTPIGAFLRRLSLDELPQFFNVLKGEMSVVGPRPERPFFVEKFSREIPHYNLRHRGQVGITGLAQIYGYRGDTCIRSRADYDRLYLETWSFRLDLKIIWRTAKSLVAAETPCCIFHPLMSGNCCTFSTYRTTVTNQVRWYCSEAKREPAGARES